VAREYAPQAALILGSGLGRIAERVAARHVFDFSQIPELIATDVEGHSSRLLLGEWAGRRVCIFSGRLHRYEGHARDRVLAPIRLASLWGASTLILTNAAGGIREDLVPGKLMVIAAHLDLTRSYPWPDGGVKRQAAPYSRRLLSRLQKAAKDCGILLAEGTYAAVLGPNYETPAEIRAFRRLGADAVGMSTAHEADAAAELGLECVAVSCITNRAAGLSATRLTHEEVLLHSKQQTGRLGDALAAFLSGIL
jgi:purine-nucleoside phosphorylase